ncbi:related to vesicular transport-associated repeat protein Tb-291 [Cephalotrichum gorgonifer]|uniref:EKC/KEOPS complex subunit BUD32 n=1 Tax=Cephalotrichum gorgonifer TaxID=2041049 RepID=A0AAE8N2Z8_9PEZI|nr:related to vesicular transport-associated repeat protein Tb-291 [Cephalotrichum gorgonifer]
MSPPPLDFSNIKSDDLLGVGLGLVSEVVRIRNTNVVAKIPAISPVFGPGFHEIEKKVYERVGKHPHILQLPYQAASAVAHIHSLGIVHGDLSIHNFIIDSNGDILLCDFAGAGIDGGRSYVAHGTRYADPLRRHEEVITQRDDVFALGMVLYELARGNLLFEGLTDDEIYHRLERRQFPDLSIIPMPLRGVIEKCWTVPEYTALHALRELELQEVELKVMDSPKPTLGLEKELTCSICTDLLYQPLTLLDCLHTFCGACLKDWFAFQANALESAPTAPPPGTPTFTCPSCRAAVRDTRHNATVATLLDMFLSANPEKDRSAAEKEEVAGRYKRGEAVLPKPPKEKSSGQLRAEEEDRRLVEEVRALSLREMGVDGPGRSGAGPGAGRPRSRHPPDSSRSGDERRRERRSESRRRDDEGEGRHRARRSESRMREDEVEARTRQIEHQSSIRSLIGSANMSERDIEREIEEFARQIQEEGILDGLDLDNIDLTRDDDLSRKITEAYRRRQRERSRQESTRRESTEADAARPDLDSSDSALPSRDDRPTGRRRNSASARVNPESRSRSQSVTTRTTSGTGHLEVQRDDRRQRRRTASSGRSSTTPVAPRPVPDPVAARSQTDLALQTRTTDPTNPRSVLGENRTISSPTTVAVGGGAPVSEGSNRSFASRVPLHIHAHSQSGNVTPTEPSPSRIQPHRPAELSPQTRTPPTQSPLPSPGHKRTPPLLFAEPSISCSRCARQHIEYELHYTCSPCSTTGAFTLCLPCYRAGKGCRHWFGFGHDAYARWDRARRENPSLEPPHKLRAGRYTSPRTLAVKDDSGVVRTSEDPAARLQSGAFCDGCLAWASECFWRCSSCNRGEWGFCDSCVSRGKCCTHPLLPLAYQPPPAAQTPTVVVNLPRRAVVAAGAAGGGGTFRPLTFTTKCDLCTNPIPPLQARYHCFSCAGSADPGARPGDYDICAACYSGLVSRGRVTPENGPAGWRRCLAGHRMIMVAFQEGSDGLYRYVSKDQVGGHRMWVAPITEDVGPGVEKWCWREGRQAVGRAVSLDVAATAPVLGEGVREKEGKGEVVVPVARFPADGGGGMVVRARWAWFPEGGEEADDVLYFPKGAEIREVEDLTGDWFVGRYMGREAVFPAAYVVVV